MRVVWSFSLLFVACGGRTFGDPIFDDMPEGGATASGGRLSGGANGTGGTSTGGTHTGGANTGGAPGKGGAPNLGGSATSGGTFATGGFGGAIANGGRVGSGGTLAAGGTFMTGGTRPRGGAPTFGGNSGTGGIIFAGGAIATGGVGGAPVIDKSCTQFCDRVQGLCGLPSDGSQQCAVGCSQPFASGSPACQAATRALLDCVNMALSLPLASCEAIGALALLRCSDQLLKANACDTVPPEMCTESLGGSGQSCERVRSCGTTEYRTTCTSSATFSSCICRVNGVGMSKMGSSGQFDACELATSFPCP
ncbi:MAG TPA: hypothetical protein VG937_27740 [Polyangiaceae bacterium]|nr:hypothetical protein [Polyangiaceae bacterium]